MTIKIKKVSIEKDGSVPELIGGKPVRTYKRFKGGFDVEVGEGNIKGKSEVKIGTVSEEVQDELYTVLSRIENELNGIENKPPGIKIEVGLDLTTKKAVKELIQSYEEHVANTSKGEVVLASKDARENVISKIAQTLNLLDAVESINKEDTDKYKKALNSINEAVEKVIEYRSYLTVNSEEYRNGLEDEIELQKKKSDLLKKMQLDILKKMEIELILEKCIQDKHLLLTDGKNYTTFLKVESKDNLATTIHELAASLIGNEYKVVADRSSTPDFMTIQSLDDKIVYYLINYDSGMIVV